MGKRNNKNKNKKLLKNSVSEKKPGTLLEQDGAGRRQSSPKPLLPENNIESSHKNFENSNNEIKKSNYQMSKRSDLMKSAGHACTVIESKATNYYKGKNSKKESSVLSVSGARVKQGKKVTSNHNVNESEFNLCEDLFSENTFTPGSNDYNPHDCNSVNSKDILNPSCMKEKHIDQKDSRIKNSQKVVISEKNWNDANQTSENEKNKEIKPNKQVFQNRDVTKFIPKQVLFQDKQLIPRNVSQNRSFESKKINENQNSGAPNFSGARPKYKQNVISDIGVKEHENCLFDKYSYESDNDCKERRNSEQKLNSKQIIAKENFVSSVNQYNHSKDTFSSIYHKWLPERKSSLKKLLSLLEEVQDIRMKYNEVQANFKDCTAQTRSAKISSDSILVNFLASAVTVACDAVSGLASFAEAVNTDSFQSKFQEIMDHDAEITKALYESRSQCVTEYQGIEEVMKKFHCNTLTSTVSTISDTLEVGKYWEAMKKSYRNDDMASLMDIVGKFFNNACESEVLGKVCNSLETYVSDNPAALEGCKSVGKSMYGYVNVWAPIYNRKGIRGKLDLAVNGYLMLKDQQEAEHLRNNCNKSKLEFQIEDAIDLLKSELEEISDTYNGLFQNKIQNSWE